MRLEIRLENSFELRLEIRLEIILESRLEIRVEIKLGTRLSVYDVFPCEARRPALAWRGAN